MKSPVSWIKGLSTLGKFGVVSVATAGLAAVPAAASYCGEAPLTHESTEIVAVQPRTMYLKDGSQQEGKTKTKTEGVAGTKNVKYRVTTKCNKEISKVVLSEEQTKAATDTVVLKGTKHNVTEDVAIPFTSSTENNASLDKGTTQIKTIGINGSKRVTYEVYQNEGEPEVKKALSETVSVQPVNAVSYVGTRSPQPTCPNGTYTNTYGSVVCSPYSSPSAPVGATAVCGDGTYSFSQSRSGTCSHHGGVARWL